MDSDIKLHTFLHGFIWYMRDADLENIFEQKHKLFYLSAFVKLKCFDYQRALERNLSKRCLKTSKSF